MRLREPKVALAGVYKAVQGPARCRADQIDGLSMVWLVLRTKLLLASRLMKEWLRLEDQW